MDTKNKVKGDLVMDIPCVRADFFRNKKGQLRSTSNDKTPGSLRINKDMGLFSLADLATGVVISVTLGDVVEAFRKLIEEENTDGK